MKKWILLSVVVVMVANVGFAQSWVRPSVQSIQSALDAGFSGHPPAGKQRYRYFRHGLGWTASSGMELQYVRVVPPLYCAFQAGKLARMDLRPEPSASLTRAACDGFLAVEVRHFSAALGANWAAAIRGNGKMLRAVQQYPDRLPVPIEYYPWSGPVYGYSYFDQYSFRLTSPPNKGDVLILSSGLGKRHMIKVPWSFFGNDPNLASGTEATR